MLYYKYIYHAIKNIKKQLICHYYYKSKIKYSVNKTDACSLKFKSVQIVYRFQVLMEIVSNPLLIDSLHGIP
jgi:hypothetical protein